MHTHRADARRPVARFLRDVGIVALAAGLLGACGDILAVDLPGDITEADLQDPAMARTLVMSGISMYECSFSTFTAAQGDGMADHWTKTVGWWGNVHGYDELVNTTQCALADNSYGWYVPLQMARMQLEQAHRFITGWTDQQVANRQQLLALAATYVGLSYQMLGEHFCEMAIDGGPRLSPDQTLAIGEEWFDRALNHVQSAGGDFGFLGTNSVRQLAQLGRMRVRWAQGNRTGAVDDALQIQPGFIAYATREGTDRRRWNVVYQSHNVAGWSTIASQRIHQGALVPFTGYRYLTVDAQGRSQVNGHPVTKSGVADPRVPVRLRATPTVAGTPEESYEQTKYLSTGARQILAKWAEANLILAEVEGGSAAVARINAGRDAHGLPRYSGSDAADIRNTILEERRREFFLEGRFWSEKLRNDLWFPRGVGTSPIVARPWGTATCVLMPQIEYDLNPNL
jgi:hypothetical protein